MRLIDADALKEWVENWFTMNRYYHPYAKSNNIPIPELYDLLERMPTIDAVPVVRCRECRWWDQKEDSQYGYCYACRHNFFSSNWEISIRRTYREDFFCADGERKDGDGDG